MRKNIFKKTISIVLTVVIILQIYFLAEPVIAVDDTDGVLVTLTVDSGITISNGENVIMAPNLGIESNSSMGESFWIVRTNNITGYYLSVRADADPALQTIDGKTIEDYTETDDGVPEPWSVPASTKEFGFSAYGADTPTATWGTSLSCGSSLSGLPATNQNYVGFKTTDQEIARKGIPTFTEGVKTTICFEAEQDTVYATPGVYTANITATAVTL